MINFTEITVDQRFNHIDALKKYDIEPFTEEEAQEIADNYPYELKSFGIVVYFNKPNGKMYHLIIWTDEVLKDVFRKLIRPFDVGPGTFLPKGTRILYRAKTQKVDEISDYEDLVFVDVNFADQTFIISYLGQTMLLPMKRLYNLYRTTRSASLEASLRDALVDNMGLLIKFPNEK